MANRLTTYDPELETFEGEGEVARQGRFEIVSEIGEMTFAADLLELTNEQEFNRLLGKLIVRVGRTLGITVRSSDATATAIVLKAALKRLLPPAAAALRPGIADPYGAVMGSRLASVASTKLGLELEGLSQEDQDFETARRLVRFAIEAVKNALLARGMDAEAAAWAGILAAAQCYAPGLPRDLETNGAAVVGLRGDHHSLPSQQLCRRGAGAGSAREPRSSCLTHSTVHTLASRGSAISGRRS